MTKVTLTQDQQNASDIFLDFLVDDTEKFMVIQGGAGSGKSFLLKHLINNFEKEYKTYNLLLHRDPSHEFFIQLTATTNKAVKVVTDFTQDPDTRTIHNYLGLKVTNNYRTGKTSLEKTNEWRVKQNVLLIIDEASFIDDQLFKLLDEAMGKNCKILLVGDQYQLAPVGQTVSAMESLSCPKAYMNKIVRNSGSILEASIMFRDTVKSKKFNSINYADNNLIHVDGPTFKQLIEDTYTASNYHSNSAKILAWTNAKVQAYNEHIRDILGLTEQFSQGEVVITNNPILGGANPYPVDSHVTITDIEGSGTIHNVQGRWVTIDNCRTAFLANNFQDTKALLKRLAKQKDWKEYFDIKEQWFDLRSVYSSSVHKSQGSTYDTVFIDLNDIGSNWISSDVARLLYVAISRASKKVICYGNLPSKYSGG